jgi:hypothetical protein
MAKAKKAVLKKSKGKKGGKMGGRKASKSS